MNAAVIAITDSVAWPRIHLMNFSVEF